MLQTEKFNVLIDQFNGLFTARDSDDIPDSASPDLLNVRLNGSNFRAAKGYELAGARNSDTGEIISQYTFRRIDGKEVMLRVKDDAATGTLEWYDATNNAWYTLLASLTTGKIMGFTEFNTSTTNQCIFCNGVENISVWTGATTRLTSAVLAAATTINVADTTDFAATGTIMYNGTEIAYTGKTATTFTVGSAHASSGANDGVANAADDSTHSGVTKGNILLSAKDRFWIAGQPGGPNNYSCSDEGEAFVFTAGTARANSVAGEIFNIGGRITGMIEKGEEIIFLGPDGAIGYKFVYPTDITKAPIYREIFRAPGQGCIYAKSVFKVNNEVYFANENGIQSLTDLEGTEKITTKSITRDILPTLQDYVLSEAACIYFDKEKILLMAMKTDADLAANDVVIGIEFYRTKKGADTFGILKFDWPVNDWAILADELYFGSSLEMNSFRALQTYQNDGAPRNVKYATKRFNFRNPFQTKGARLAAVRGFIGTATDIKVEVLYNAGFKSTQTKTIESTGAYVSAATLNTIGAFQLGTNPIGATLAEVSELKDFTVFLDLGVDVDFRDIQLIFTSDSDGGAFIITHVGIAISEEGYASEDPLTI